MKINRLETHDRLLHFKEDQAINIFQGADDCMRKNPLSLALQMHSPYIYIYAHPRTADDGVNKRMLWQPRLAKPSAETNSYLFRAESHTDLIETCWLLPPEETWDQYKLGNVTENELVLWSIDMLKKNKAKLEAPEPDDLPDSRIREIYRLIASEMRFENKIEKLLKPKTSEASLILPY